MLLPAGSNHLDPMLTVNGYDQSNDIMRPDQVVGQRDRFESDIEPLEDAFGWGRSQNLTINTNYTGFTPAAAGDHRHGARRPN